MGNHSEKHSSVSAMMRGNVTRNRTLVVIITKENKRMHA